MHPSFRSIRTFIPLAFLLNFYSAFAQDTTFYDFKWTKIKSLIGARYFELTQKDSADPAIYVVRKYARPKTLLEETRYSDTTLKIQNGLYRKFYESGDLHIVVNFKNGKMDGDLITYWGEGQLKRKDKYENGNFISGKILNTNGRELEYYPFIILPSFRGGEKKLNAYLQRELHYPPSAREKKIEGIVQVGFTISDKGVIRDVKLIKGVQKDLDAEALRLTGMMPRWNPKMIDGISEEMFYIFPVKFDLP